MSTVSAPQPGPRVARPRATRQKAAVDRALDRIPDFVSAQELYARLQDQGERVSLATVYRTLQQQLDDGLVDMLRRDDGETVYRRCEDEGHHHHLVCRICWTTVEVTAPHVEAWATAVAAEHGFTDADHTVEITGVCARCRAEGRTRAA
ncbi:Fur family transcriptional regulator [Micrococcus yunnanensis]|uniref:Fur family transcriptional regulator n=1 Tax=Micrococcus TaxID=1269 RepID=UPI0019D01D60|nr:Fur family transcriptional regulator [Micrococcus luteus]MBN6767473.1 transcriptional repressor [Micrococcus luteus]MBN6827388.1 transcriptional repressor [Micrococcus luteus]MBN6846589.1 transcriptional repressor [Micrococcus luteus]MBN6862692.1 transcriptional repressor [Micrococcus luteus]MBN6863975.1 transcriptional repressor [Micrococcus luteus]